MSIEIIEKNPLRESRTAGNENTGLLKLIAILCMIVDHAGAAFFPQYREMRVIGRIALPLFAWGLVVGCCYTRNIWKYALRIFLVGLIAQPCYMLGLNHKWYQWNVFATLLLGVLAIAGIRKKWYGSHVWAPILAILAACAVQMDYGWKGVAFILILYACRERKATIAAGMTAFCLYWGYGSSSLTSFLGIPAVRSISFLPQAGTLLMTLAQIQFWAILALPLILIPMRGRISLPKWAGYAAYPVHLLIIGLIRLAK
ncbi:MAG: hypothetical protein IJ662_08020 [Clostridia bacterium]|nr:hypothetical protein [Clostridia bacterium]